MNYAQAEKMLKSCGQEHVLAYWKKLSKKEQAALLGQIATIEPKSVRQCRAALGVGVENGCRKESENQDGKAPKVAELKGAALKKAIAAGEK